jgi:hypothetical protein
MPRTVKSEMVTNLRQNVAELTGNDPFTCFWLYTSLDKKKRLKICPFSAFATFYIHLDLFPERKKTFLS